MWRSIFGGVPQKPSPLLLRWGLPLTWDVRISLGRLASEIQGLAYLHGPSPGIIDVLPCLAFSIGAGEGTQFLM